MYYFFIIMYCEGFVRIIFPLHFFSFFALLENVCYPMAPMGRWKGGGRTLFSKRQTKNSYKGTLPGENSIAERDHAQMKGY